MDTEYILYNSYNSVRMQNNTEKDVPIMFSISFLPDLIFQIVYEDNDLIFQISLAHSTAASISNHS